MSAVLEDCVEVHLMRADSAFRADFRRRVHDSPLLRLEGFDPDRDPWPDAPAGTAAPASVATLRTEYARYPDGTACVRATVRNAGAQTLRFGEDCTLCLERDGRWKRLPTANEWKSLLHELQRGRTHSFSVPLHPALYPVRYGRYRICKEVEADGRRYLLSAEFTVTPFAPRTRFDSPDVIRTP